MKLPSKALRVDEETKPLHAELEALRGALAALEHEMRNEALSHQMCRDAHCDARDEVLYEFADRLALLRGEG